MTPSSPAVRMRRVLTEDGWDLGVAVHEAVGARRAVVLLLHAMMVDARSLDRGLAAHLARAGFEVWRADLRGHGNSGPLPAQGATWSYDDLVYRDIPALVVAAKCENLPVVIIGHSLGGHTAAAAVGQGVSVDALVLLGVNIWMPRFEVSRRRRLRKAANLLLFEGVSRIAGRFPSRRLGIGSSDESTDYVSEMCRFYWRDRWAARDGTDYFADLSRFTGPVLSVAGRGDTLLGHPAAVSRFAGGFTRANVTFWLAQSGGYGLAYDPDHMGLGCDSRSRPLWSAITRWLDRALIAEAPMPTGYHQRF